MPCTATRRAPCTTLVVSPVFLSLNGGTNQGDGQVGLVLFREAMQTVVLLHLIMARATFKPDQLHASLDLFSASQRALHPPEKKTLPCSFRKQPVPAAPFRALPQVPGSCTALTTGPLHSPSVSSSSSCSKPCLLLACHVLEYLISLLRAPVWQRLEPGKENLPALCSWPGRARSSTPASVSL